MLRSKPPNNAFWTSGFADAGGLRIHYLRAPDPSPKASRPTIVCAHGVTDNGRCFTTLAEALVDRFDVVAYDARGHGQSDHPEADYAPRTQAADLLGLLDALRLERPVLYGHSIGASTVAWFVAEHPTRVRALVLEDPVDLHPYDPYHFARLEQATADRAQIHAWAANLQKLPMQAIVAYARLRQHPRWDPREAVFWAEAKKQVSLHAINVFDGMRDQPITDAFPRIRAPTLVLKADAQGAHRRADEASIGQIPQATLVHVPGAGHNVRRDAPAATLGALQRFFAAVQPSSSNGAAD